MVEIVLQVVDLTLVFLALVIALVLSSWAAPN